MRYEVRAWTETSSAYPDICIVPFAENDNIHLSYGYALVHVSSNEKEAVKVARDHRKETGERCEIRTSYETVNNIPF